MHRDDLLNELHDQDQLLGVTRRIIREEVSMLNDGLIALQRNPPKVAVAVDHMERVIARLQSHLNNLTPKE